MGGRAQASEIATTPARAERYRGSNAKLMFAARHKKPSFAWTVDLVADATMVGNSLYARWSHAWVAPSHAVTGVWLYQNGVYVKRARRTLRNSHHDRRSIGKSPLLIAGTIANGKSDVKWESRCRVTTARAMTGGGATGDLYHAAVAETDQLRTPVGGRDSVDLNPKYHHRSDRTPRSLAQRRGWWIRRFEVTNVGTQGGLCA